MSYLGVFLLTSAVKSSAQHMCDLNSAVVAPRDADVTSRQREAPSPWMVATALARPTARHARNQESASEV